MLKIIMPTIMLIPLTWHSNSKAVWINTTAHSLMISIMGLPLINQFTDNSLNMSLMFFSDALSTPLLSLTLWFLPVMIIASQFHLTNETPLQQKLYLTMLILLQIFLIMTFTATELIMFYILFEATLLSTLILITRWGTQTERLNAGLYFQFYTPVGSLPLLITLLHLQSSIESNPSPSPSPKNPNPNP